MKTSLQKIYKPLIGFLFLVEIGVYGIVKEVVEPEWPSIYFLNVGRGDASLIKTKRVNVLIDAGPSAGIVQELDSFLLPTRRVIDIFIISHSNYDHFGGAFALLQRYEVRLVMMSGIKGNSEEFTRFLKILKERKIPIVYSRAGQKILWQGTRIDILWPDFSYGLNTVLSNKQLNDSSIVALAAFRNIEALFSGDITAKVEQKIAAAVRGYDIEILKVPHHGSKYSSSADFLRLINPELAVISVGRNSYGHPTSEVLSRLGEVGAEILRTDLNGTIQVIMHDPQRYIVRSTKSQQLQ